jgi:hypothetical protein
MIDQQFQEFLNKRSENSRREKELEEKNRVKINQINKIC